ncbi:hypothetical protein [Candidatus Synechococcus spongiarum]|uniref:Uncharacterized protein n=1 Tax=Candidatus Synechococcus spongiarum TaxID=431041 RepID=A0A164Y484_9SYNE|nr:hypothetical protein [Candidatus Synechococcus spongiarum]SAY38970.1 hypothetical protein FLM9_991 [Candidatus Synechococcus spongiarum]
MSVDPGSLEAALHALDLPDPEADDLSEVEFLEHVDRAWSVCERFDLQTEIWRGRILRRIRDRGKHQGQSRGTPFLQWLRERDISKSQAYGLIQLADSADDLVTEGSLDPACVNNFSKHAFLATAKAAPAVQELVNTAANGGERITRQEVKCLDDKFAAISSTLLPEEVRQRTQAQILPTRVVAPLVKELARLPKEQQEELRQELAAAPELDAVRAATRTARAMARVQDTALALNTLRDSSLNLDKAVEEARRLAVLGLLADILHHAQQVEQAVGQLNCSWQRLGDLHGRLRSESGGSTPHLHQLLETLESLSGSPIQVSIGALGGQGPLHVGITISGG